MDNTGNPDIREYDGSKYKNLERRNRSGFHSFNPKIVSIGGGTGLSAMLRGIKRYTTDITAVVSVADDGGGSGVLRQDLNIPPPGDIRSCILALSEVEPVMERLLNYRFDSGQLKGQSFGNLFLAAMTGTFSGDFVEAVRNVCEVLNITGRVFPVTASNVELVATMEDGSTVVGESRIGRSVSERHSAIKKVRLRKRFGNLMPVETLSEIVDEIKSADLITLGPGSLYTSVLPNLVIDDLRTAVRESDAPVVYINNIMTQPGETDGYTAFDHALAILDHTFDDFLDYCIVNTGAISPELVERYKADGAVPVEYDKSRFASTSINVIERDMASVDAEGHVRHNTYALADALVDIISINRNEHGQKVSGEGVLLYTPEHRRR